MIKKFLLGFGVALFLNMAAQTQHPHRSCGTMDVLNEQLQNDPSLKQRMDQAESAVAAYVAEHQNSKANAITTIPVVFHVLYNTTAQNISDARILAQLDVLNKDYARLNADAGSTPSAFTGVASATNVQFCLAQRDPSGNATTGIVRKSTTKTSFSSTGNPAKFSSQGGNDAWPAGSYLNIWVCNLSGGLLGYAQFPGGAASTDGVVCLTGSIGGPSAPGTSTPYHLGRTLTHEVGHYLGLYHIWGDDGTACTGSDLVSDTPNQGDENYGCPVFPTVSCSNGPNGDMFMNYMDYTDDACMNMLTAGQSVRIDATMNGSRVALKTSLGCTPPTSGGCGTAAGLLATSITQTTATLNWGAVSGALSYNVQYRAVGAGAWTSTTSTTTSKGITGLVAGTNYEFQVQAVCSGATGTFSASGTFTTTSAGGSCTGDIYESNNTSSTAKVIATNTDIYALIGTSTDVDFFKFTTVSPNTKIKVTLSQLPFDYDVKLLSNGNSTLATSQLGGTSDENIVYNATSAATYKVRVYGYGGAFSATSCYKLRVNVSSTNFVKMMQANDGTNKLSSASDINAFPNPATSDIAFMYAGEMATQGSITVTDLLGKIVMTVPVNVVEGSNVSSINIESLQQGVYFVDVFTGTENLKVKVVKE